MSYCVHCGVELEKTSDKCPLCNTPVINPKQPVDTKTPKAFPTQKGKVTPVKRADAALLISIVLLSTSIACALLNLLVFNNNLWSLYIIGICIVLWILFTPAIIYSKLPIYFSILFDGAAIALYIGIIAYQFPGNGWYYYIALPIIGLLILMALAYITFSRHISSSILSRSILIFSGIGLMCAFIELLLHYYFDRKLFLSWSAVVLTCCAIIVITLLTVLKRSRLREEVRRRMHI